MVEQGTRKFYFLILPVQLLQFLGSTSIAHVGSRSNDSFLGLLTREFVMGSAVGRPEHSTGTPARGLQHGDSSTGTPARGFRFTATPVSLLAYFVASLVLLAAVIGKISILVIDPFVPVSLGFSTRGMAWAVVFFELLVLGTCQFILSRVWASYCLMAVYFVFSLNGLISIQMGRQSCGCFGVIEMPIWVSLSISLISLGLLFLGQIQIWCRGHRFHESRTSKKLGVKRISPRFLGWAIGGFLSFIIGVAIFEAEDIFQTQSINVEYKSPMALNVGVEKEVELVLQNRSPHPIRVIGYRSTCQCVVVDALFREISGGGTEVLKVRVKPREAGPFRQQLLFYFDSRVNSSLRVALDGIAIEGVL